MVAGAFGTFLPVLPGTPLIFMAALGYGFYEGFQNITLFIIVILFFLMVLTIAADYLSGVIGAKKYGASKYGIWGAFIGGLIGVIVFNIPGLLLGPFVGSVTGETITGRKVNEAVKIGLGTVVGLAGGAVFKFTVAVAMIIVFITNL